MLHMHGRPRYTVIVTMVVLAVCSGLVSGIYTTNSPEACRYVAASCQANVVVLVFLILSFQKFHPCSIDHLKERGVEKGSGQHSTL